jgi:hypothetical protein
VNIRTLFDLQRVSQSPQHYNSAIPDNTPGFIWEKRRCLRDRPIKDGGRGSVFESGKGHV